MASARGTLLPVMTAVYYCLQLNLLLLFSDQLIMNTVASQQGLRKSAKW